MIKALKYISGFVLLLLFIIVDQSGIGFREQLKNVKEWANGKVTRLKFNVATVPSKGKD